MENSIEEDIKILKELGQEYYKNGEIKIKALSGAKYIWALQNLLSDYKRVLKENEELKQDRNNNYQMIALAQNEMLGYIQGYEDGKKLKRSAVACVVENQQYYIIKKEIEHYKEYIEKLQKENEELEEINNELEAEKNEAIRRYNFETIPIQKVKDNIEELKKNLYTVEHYETVGAINALQELLERRK